jgi:hypothetical protein
MVTLESFPWLLYLSIYWLILAFNLLRASSSPGIATSSSLTENSKALVKYSCLNIIVIKTCRMTAVHIQSIVTYPTEIVHHREPLEGVWNQTLGSFLLILVLIYIPQQRIGCGTVKLSPLLDYIYIMSFEFEFGFSYPLLYANIPVLWVIQYSSLLLCSIVTLVSQVQYSPQCFSWPLVVSVNGLIWQYLSVLNDRVLANSCDRLQHLK